MYSTLPTSRQWCILSESHSPGKRTTVPGGSTDNRVVVHSQAEATKITVTVGGVCWVRCESHCGEDGWTQLSRDGSNRASRCTPYTSKYCHLYCTVHCIFCTCLHSLVFPMMHAGKSTDATCNTFASRPPGSSCGRHSDFWISLHQTTKQWVAICVQHNLSRKSRTLYQSTKYNPKTCIYGHVTVCWKSVYRPE